VIRTKHNTHVLMNQKQ